MVRGTGGGEIVLGPLVITAYTGIRETDAKGRIRFLSDGILTVENDTLIDAFLVGGGASGARATDEYFMNGSPGGGGGYTKTAKKLLLRAGIRYTITIGVGGVNDDGGGTNAFGVKADGGRMYRAPMANQTTIMPDGGSGGGGADGNGGTNGGNGAGVSAGTGQGSTTRAFGEEDGELFSGGGAGGASLYQKFPIGGAGGCGNADPDGVINGGENTGGGGAGSSWYNKTTEDENGMITVEQATTEPGAGGSGIVIIREAM